MQPGEGIMLLSVAPALLAIALVHCDDRLSSLLAIGLFATGISASVLLIAAYDRPFVGQIAVTPEPLLQIISDHPVTKRWAEGPTSVLGRRVASTVTATTDFHPRPKDPPKATRL